MLIKEILDYLETVAPPSYQEDYDNSGLIVGNKNWELQKVMLCLDSTEAVLDEAIEKGCNLVIAHHPIVFKGLKRFNGRNYVERVVMKAIKHDIAIYAIHTNLDNVYHQGVNAKIAEKLGLINTRVLAPKQNLKKLYTFVSDGNSQKIREALFEAGAGSYNDTKNSSYASIGMGTSDGSDKAEIKLEVLYPSDKESAILQALRAHSNGTPLNYDISSVDNKSPLVGSGMIGDLEHPLEANRFLETLKNNMNTGCIRHTAPLGKDIKRVAVCGGSGGFLLNKAISGGADIFITADYKYHEFFDADGQIIIADIGHYESEQYTIELLDEIITNKFSNFAVYLTEVNTNPVHYL